MAINNLGMVRPGSTLLVPFPAFDSNDPSASVIISDFVLADIGIYKGTSMTERASTTGVVLLDTDGINIDGATGIHGFSIDLSSNATADFYTCGSRFYVTCGPITIDAATINFVPATFQIGQEAAVHNTTIATLASQVSFTLTDGSADNGAYVGCPVYVQAIASAIQVSIGLCSAYTGSSKTVTLAADPAIYTQAAGDHISIFMPSNVTAWNNVLLATTNPLPNAASDGAGGLLISDAGGLDLDAMNVNINDIETDTADMQPRVVAIEIDTGTTLDGRIPAALVSGRMSSDVVSVSGDTTAADNLELQYDTTGLTGDTFPSSQAQVGAIGATAGGALSFEANADNSGGTIDPGSTAFVGNETNNFTDTDREDGTRHVITDATNVIDLVYGFSVGGGRTASKMIFKGFANANNDDLTISAWDHPGAEWETLGTLEGKNSTSNITVDPSLLSKHTGTGSEIGKVYIRFNGSSLSANADLNTDQILVEAVGIGQTVGYQLGAIWIDTDDGVAGTEDFVNGVADNPVLTLADALTIASSVKLHRFVCTPDTSITFTNTRTNEVWIGEGTDMALGGRDVGGSHFMGMDITGISSGVETHFDHCELGDMTVASAHFDSCDIEGTVICSGAANYQFVDCAHSGTGATIDFGTGVGISTTVHMHNYHGALTVKNMGQSGTDVLHWSSSNGKLILDSTCIGGTVNMNGTFDFVNSGSGMTLNRDGDAVNQILSRAKGIAKNTAHSDIEFLMVSASDHFTPKTGLTVTGTRSIDGAAFTSVDGTIAEVANGIYQFDAVAADLNGEIITFRFIATAADDRFITVKTSS